MKLISRYRMDYIFVFRHEIKPTSGYASGIIKDKADLSWCYDDAFSTQGLRDREVDTAATDLTADRHQAGRHDLV